LKRLSGFPNDVVTLLTLAQVLQVGRCHSRTIRAIAADRPPPTRDSDRDFLETGCAFRYAKLHAGVSRVGCKLCRYTVASADLQHLGQCEKRDYIVGEATPLSVKFLQLVNVNRSIRLHWLKERIVPSLTSSDRADRFSLLIRSA
jgi:hypothetical protein